MSNTLSGRKELHRYIKFVWEIEANGYHDHSRRHINTIVINRIKLMKECLEDSLNWFDDLFYLPIKVK